MQTMSETELARATLLNSKGTTLAAWPHLISDQDDDDDWEDDDDEDDDEDDDWEDDED